jgi:hypothetical protein
MPNGLPIQLLITLLEQELTEQKTDELAREVSAFVKKKLGGLYGNIAGGIVFTGLDAAMPEAFFAALRNIFPMEYQVSITAEDLGMFPPAIDSTLKEDRDI